MVFLALTSELCDEIHPVCGGCKKYDLQCDFNTSTKDKGLESLPPVQIPTLQRSGSDTSLISCSSPSETLIISSSSSSSPAPALMDAVRDWNSKQSNLWAMTMHTPQERMLELRLMHHFTTMISSTIFRLIGNSRQLYRRDFFARWLTDIAMQKPELMDGLLGFSAFNLRKLEGGTDKELSLASHHYMTTAIKAHSEELKKGISHENAEILFAGGALIAFASVSSHEYLFPDQDYSLPMHWFRPWLGVRSIVRSSTHFLHSEEILMLLETERHAFNSDFIPPTIDAHRFDFLLEGLDRSALDPETLEAYEKSVYWLALIEDNPNDDYCFKFTAKVPPRFVQMLFEHDPRTLTIVGYFFMTLQQTEQVSWLPRTTGKEFRALMRLLPEEWKPRMAQAVKVFEAG